MATNRLTKTLRRKQLDRTLAGNAALLPARPRQGWLREIRASLGMTGDQLAARLGVGQSTVARLERAEQVDAITLKTLRRVAEAMGCQVVYALVPNGSLEEIVEQQALRQAAQLVGRVEHSMGLEAQSRSAATIKAEVEQLAAELVRTMSPELWRAEPRQ